MSLALAEILIKSDGNGSLDKARGEHAHHGLTLRTHPVKKGKFDLETVSKALTASPLAVAGIRRGTFDLWHRVAKGCPIVGKRTISTGKGTFYIYDEVFDPSAERMPLLPKNGFSFWDCLQGCPGMHDYMFELSDASNVVIGEVELTESTLTNVKRYKVLLHPGRTEAIDNIFTANNFASSKFRNVIFSSYESGFEATFELCGGSNVLPPCASWSTDEIRFLPPQAPLNEFGYYYLGLYILGNYARYFPDHWMQDVESGSPLALASDEFLNTAESRMALLALSELSKSYHIYE